MTVASLNSVERIPHVSELLEARDYDGDTQIYDCQQGSAICIEIMPFIGLDERSLLGIKMMLTDFDLDNLSIQVINWSSGKIASPVTRWQKGRKNGRFGFTEARGEMFKKAVAGKAFATQFWRPKHYRVLIVLHSRNLADSKPKKDALRTHMERLMTGFKSLGTQSRVVTPKILLNFCHEVLSPRFDETEPPSIDWNEDDPINLQLSIPGQAMEVKRHGILFDNEGGASRARAYTVSKYPEEWQPGASGTLIGDVFTSSLFCPWPVLKSISITGSKMSADMAGIKSTRATQAANSPLSLLRPEVKEISEDWQRTAQDLSRGETMVTALYQVVLFCEEDQKEDAETKIKNIYNSSGFTLTPENGIHLPALAIALPFGSSIKSLMVMKRFSRTRTIKMNNALALWPLFGEWQGNAGARPPLMLLAGRRGQIAGWTPFQSEANFNVSIVGKSGSGKSVAMQEIMSSLVAVGGSAIVIDDGYSFINSAEILGGTHVDFGGIDLRINPFAAVDTEAVADDEEFKETAFSMLVAFISALCHPGAPAEDLERAILSDAVKTAWTSHGSKASLNTIVDILKAALPNNKKETKSSGGENRVRADLITLMKPFCSDGAYGRIFSEGCSVSLDASLVVFEMSNLRDKKEIQAASMVLLIFLATQKMYHSPRDVPVAIMIDEAWSLLSGTTADFVEGVARRARKYNGSLITATQGVEDFFRSKAAEAAWSNSDWTIFFGQRDSSIEQLKAEKRIQCDEVLERALRSLNSLLNVWSEAIIYGPSGWDIMRLCLDSVSLTAFSSKGEDVVAIENLMKGGATRGEAITQLAHEKRPS